MTQSARTSDTAPSGVTETTLPPLLVLSAVLVAGWTLWTFLVRSRIPVAAEPVETAIGLAARTVFWLVPSAIYLARYWGPRWPEPLGLGFPLGQRQVVRTIVLTFLVAMLLFVGTAPQKNLGVIDLLVLFSQRARPDLVSPVFEELVFRGLLVGELINWARDSSKTALELRARFWGSLLFSALVFTAMHWPGWLVHFGPPGAFERTGSIFVTGLVLAFVFSHTRSVWACIFLHWVNNQLSQMG